LACWWLRRDDSDLRSDCAQVFNQHEDTMNTISKACIFTLLLLATTGHAAVRKTGTWPEKETRISIELDKAPLPVALRKVAEKAQWSLVLPDATLDGTVTVAVKDQPADKVLEMLVPENVALHAHREGSMVRFTAEPEPATTASVVAPGPAVAPVPTVAASSAPCVWTKKGCYDADKRIHDKGHDRASTGSALRIEKDEVVHDVAVLGGPVDVYGVVTGDLAVTGGNLRVHEGAIIVGDVDLIGGTGHVEKGGRVDGHIGVVGGLTHDEGAILGGDVEQELSVKEPESLAACARHEVGDLLTSFALLFVLGVVFLALAEGRMERLRVEIAARPVRNFALGIVGVLGFAAAATVLCVTILGIPVALVLSMLAVVAVFAALCATAQLVGEMFLRHKTINAHVHLAAGLAALLLFGRLPWIGGWLLGVATLVGVGALVTTRVAGLAIKQQSAGPYRTLGG
jgi:hypothetical protein